MTDLFQSSSAEVSPCGRYRYRLDRRWADGPTMGFIMLNPSTADAEQDDPTIRHCIGFAKREGCGALRVVNIFPYRATKPADLWLQPSPVRCGGPEGEIELERAVRESSIIIAAWGADARGGDHWITMRHWHSLFCLGKTKDGSPRHPLYVRADAPFIPYR
jgi:hypothetical protein